MVRAGVVTSQGSGRLAGAVGGRVGAVEAAACHPNVMVAARSSKKIAVKAVIVA